MCLTCRATVRREIYDPVYRTQLTNQERSKQKSCLHTVMCTVSRLEVITEIVGQQMVARLMKRNLLEQFGEKLQVWFKSVVFIKAICIKASFCFITRRVSRLLPENNDSFNILKIKGTKASRYVFNKVVGMGSRIQLWGQLSQYFSPSRHCLRLELALPRSFEEEKHPHSPETTSTGHHFPVTLPRSPTQRLGGDSGLWSQVLSPATGAGVEALAFVGSGRRIRLQKSNLFFEQLNGHLFFCFLGRHFCR